MSFWGALTKTPWVWEFSTSSASALSVTPSLSGWWRQPPISPPFYLPLVFHIEARGQHKKTQLFRSAPWPSHLITPCHRLNYIPCLCMCWPWKLRTVLGETIFKEVKLACHHWEWALIQYDWCLLSEGLDIDGTQRKRPWGPMRQPSRTKERGLRRNQPCWHLISDV